MSTLLFLLTLVGCAYWALNAYGAWRVPEVPVLGEVNAPLLERWPKVSVIIPACDEATTLVPAMESKLAEGYPALELVLVDDQSTDETPRMVDELAAKDGRVVPIHLTELPEGWLGKLNAMNEGVKRATGEWLLFSDADVHFTPGVLQRAVAYCEQQGLDHLAVFPEIWPTEFTLDCATAAFTRFAFLGGRFWAVADPRSRASAGVGAFNLVRRSALEKTRGLEWLKLEVSDDAALGQMLKRAGAASRILGGRGQLGLKFYSTLQELARSSEKVAPMFRFSLPRALVGSGVLATLELSPLIAQLGGPVTQSVGLLAMLLATFSSLAVAKYANHPFVPALLWPIGSALMPALLLRGGVLGAKSGGLTWRGTHYPARVLLEGKRLDFP